MKIVIAGAGPGGLATALALHTAGHEVQVYEQVQELRALGVGINLLPHAVGILHRYGLADALAEVAIDAQEYVFMNRFGQEILADARGLAAGYAYPQYSIHRGDLQRVLLEAVSRSIGPAAIRTGAKVVRAETIGDRARATLADRAGNALGTVEADLVIAADGIHSAIRAQFNPDEGMPIWNGATMWRGVTIGKPFRTGASIIKAGWTERKFVAYPISKKLAAQGRALINWICDVHEHGERPLAAREDWNRPGRLDDFLPKFADWHFPFLDVPDIVRRAEYCYEFPMVDRDPLARWSHGRVTLLGDAAHPMYPISSNGASQAILDAEALAASLAAIPDPVAALADYDAKRIPPTAEIVRMNRRQGPDVILDIVHERAPNGFARLADVVPPAELAAILARYKVAAGHQQRRAAA